MKKLFISQPMKDKPDEELLKERENGPYLSLYDFCKRISHKEINKKAIENLIYMMDVGCIFRRLLTGQNQDIHFHLFNSYFVLILSLKMFVIILREYHLSV